MISKAETKKSVWYSSYFIIASLLGFLNYSLCFKTLEFSSFGLFIFLSSVFMIGNSLDFGFGLSSIKHISHARVSKDYDFISSYFSTFFYTYIILGLIIGFSFILYYILFLSDSEIINSVLEIRSFGIYLFLACSFFLNYQTGFLRCILEGMSDYINLSKISIIVAVFNTLFVLILFFMNLDVYFLAVITLSVSLISFMITLTYLLIRYKFISIGFKKFDANLIKKYYKYGLNINMSIFIGSLADPIIKYLIGSSISLSFLTFYESAKKIINFSSGLIVSAQRSLFVRLSEANAVGELKKFTNESLYYYSKMANYYSVLLYGLFNPLICVFILIWFNTFESVIIFLIFSMAYSLINFGGSLYNVLMVEGKGIALLLIQSTNVVTIYLFLAFSLNLFNSYLGLFGFYICTVISIVLIFYYLKKSQDLNYKTYLKRIDFNDILKLNISILLETILLFIFDEKKYILLIIFQVLNVFLFRKYIKFAFKKLEKLA